MGYTAKAEKNYWSWDQKDNKQYALLFLIIVIIFFTTSILFNSLKQPLAVIFVIPISYIGVFLTFYWFKLNFDQGGFASFVLLCGITVNASIYILNEFIPFMLGTDKEAFWFPLAAGTIGGLIMSILGIFFYLPIFTLKKERH